MRNFLKISLMGMAALTMVAMSCNAQKGMEQKNNYVSFVDPFIGSGGHGHVFVGANVPFGAIQLGPQNIFKGWDWCSGYHYSDSIIVGFNHSHLSGTGCSDLGDVILMPFIGAVRTTSGTQDNIEGSCSSYYRHANEKAAPGYYSVKLDNGVKVELTATERVGMHHYIYPEGTARLLINLKDGNDNKTFDTYMKKIDANTIEGYRFVKGWSPMRKVFFYMKLNRPIESLQLFHSDAAAGFDSLNGDSIKGVVTFGKGVKDVLVKVSLSSVSCANAKANMDAELPAWDFNQVHQAAIDKWNRQLSSISAQTNDNRAKKIFYTAMYHASFFPCLYCDVNGEFRGMDDKIYSDTKWTNYSIFSLWDTYRTFDPLMTILNPKMMGNFVNSFLSIYDQNGKLPIWPLQSGETECMPGYSSIPIIADCYLKGIGGFDAERALKDMVASATYDKQNGVTYVKTMGYIPADKIHEATSIAMEYAADDWGLAEMAKKMGKEDIYKTFIARGHYYEKYFDKSIRFVRPKLADGSWRTPYDPFNSIHSVGDFTEGTGWQYTFFVPQHPEGLISILGGDARFISKLDSLFIVHGDMGKQASNDISGLIGQYAHGNEPSHHVAYLYPYAGAQWKTAKIVRQIQKDFYTDQPDGIIGNEDCGQMSAWHILSALGFYQVNPSNGVFVFGSPLFDKASVNVGNGKRFEVIAKNNSPKNIYIQSVMLNGKPYENAWISYQDIMKGGTLTFTMGDQPNKSFGAASQNRPKTLE